MNDELPVLRFESRITRADFLVHFLCHNLPWRWILWITALGAGIAFATLVAPHDASPATRMLWGSVAFLGALALFCVVTTSVYAFRLWRLPAGGPLLRSREITIDAAGYHGRQDESHTTFAWAALDKLMVTKRFVRIRVRDAGELELLLPRRDLPEGGVEAIRAHFEASRPSARERGTKTTGHP